MRSEIIGGALIIATAIVGVRYFENQYPAQVAAAEEAEFEATLAQAATVQNHWSDVVRIPAARDNQFYVDADVNRRSAKFLIDTGASYVALRDTDARNAGVYTSWSDYSYPVRTANGETKAAFVTLDEMEINGIRVENVKAFVLKDDQLATNLLGMSFLSRIESVEARAGEMILRG